MEYFSGIVPEHRWKNEMLAEVKKTNELLGKIVALLNQKNEEALPCEDNHPKRGRKPNQ